MCLFCFTIDLYSSISSTIARIDTIPELDDSAVLWSFLAIKIILYILFRCGLRGGYVEVVGMQDDVMSQLKKLQSAQLGSNVVGQIVVDCIMDPPLPGDESYDLFMKVAINFESRNKIIYLYHIGFWKLSKKSGQKNCWRKSRLAAY